MAMARRLGGTSFRHWPSSMMRPCVGDSKPAMRRRAVVLPHPDGPRRVTNSPWAMSSETSSTAVNRKVAYLTWFEHLLQRRGYFTRRRQSFKFSTDYTLPIHHKNPRFRVQTPLLHCRRHPLCSKVLPDFLMREDDAITISGQKEPHHINHWSTDAAGAEFWRGKYNDLRLALGDRIGNADLMQARVWWIAGIDVVQVGDITGDEVVTAWGWRTGCRGARRFLDIHGKSRHLRGTVALHGQHLQTPGARPRKGDLRHVDAPHIGLFIVH